MISKYRNSNYCWHYRLDFKKQINGEMDMLFIAAPAVTTGKLSPLIRQGPDCRRQSSWQRVKGCDSYQCKGKAQLLKRNLKCTQGQAQNSDRDYARWQWNRLGVPRKPIVTGQKHQRLFYQNPLRKGKAFGHLNQYLSAAGAGCQGAVRERWTKIPTICIPRQ